MSTEEMVAETIEETTPVEETTVEEIAPVEEEAVVEEETTPVEEEWTPDYSFKVLDKEHEMDEFIRPVVNKENYDKVKELYEKAYGLDHVKEKYTREKEESTRLKDVEGQYSKQTETLKYLDKLLDKKDYNAFFKAAQIPQEDILKHALELAQYQEMDAQQKQAYDAQLQERERLHTLEMQNQQLYSQNQQQVLHQQHTQLDSVLSNDEVQQAVADFDARVGRPGAFKEEVINRGAMREQTSNGQVVLTPAQAVEEVMKLYGPTSGNTQVAQPQAAPVHPGEKPTLPNLQAGSKSPAKKVYKSLDEIKKLAQNYEY